MQKYDLYYDGRLMETFELRAEDPHRHALWRLQFTVEPEPVEGEPESNEVREYTLVDCDDTIVCQFFDTWHESACIRALMELGFDLEPADCSPALEERTKVLLEEIMQAPMPLPVPPSNVIIGNF